MQNLADIRKEYAKASLDISIVDKDPIRQFEAWFREAMAAEVEEPNAMHLATVNSDGRPSGRIVLLKGVEENMFIFYTNYQSKKGLEIEQNPACALTFFWPPLERQVRIEGIAFRVDSEVSDAYFKSRPRGSQIGAWASPQSSMIETRLILEERVHQLEKKYENREVIPRPHQWGGYKVDPYRIEFWQGRPNRLHDRIEYTKSDGVWKIFRLAP